MKPLHAPLPRFEVVLRDAEAIILRDVGPRDQKPSFEDELPRIVQILWRTANLKNGRKLMYFNSLNVMCEVHHFEGKMLSERVAYVPKRLMRNTDGITPCPLCRGVGFTQVCICSACGGTGMPKCADAEMDQPLIVEGGVA